VAVRYTVSTLHNVTFQYPVALCTSASEISAPSMCNGFRKKVKISLLQAVEGPRVVRGQGSHIT
jgi:hypothetical protein